MQEEIHVLVNQAIARMSPDLDLHTSSLPLGTTTRTLAENLSVWLKEELKFAVPWHELQSGYVFVHDAQDETLYQEIELAVLLEDRSWQGNHMVYVSREVPSRHVERLAKEALASYINDNAEEVIVGVTVIDKGEYA